MDQTDGMYQEYYDVKETELDPKFFEGPENVECKTQSQENNDTTLPKRPEFPREVYWFVVEICEGKRAPWCSENFIEKQTKIKALLSMKQEKMAYFLINPDGNKKPYWF